MVFADIGRRQLVMFAALYGASGRVVGARVAGRLRVALLDRQIPSAAAARAGLSERLVADVAETIAERRTAATRIPTS
jgi:enoyl-CoA hydratase/carnithine racemase